MKKEGVDATYLSEEERRGYLSLKEAGVLTGYTPDYIGQLIRSGKIRGKQVYTNVSWVTTREDIEAYLVSRKKAGDVAEEDVRIDRVFGVVRYVLYVSIGFLGLLLLFLWYILIASIDNTIEENYVDEPTAIPYVEE